ncbi:MAG: enoyl-CoA hydratase/isomerase family protein [Chloroflexi bacterium]|nr:enoyl-CoA hydratase/isomerase family protein [Chloroflexota bacterium]
MVYETILTEIKDGVFTITLNRPDKLNSFNDKMFIELTDAVKQVERDASARCVVLTGAGKGFCAGQARCVVLTGAGKGFCAGQDLSSAKERMLSGEMSYGHHLRGTYNPLIVRMINLPKPIIAAINGAAAGAGMSLAMACDLRLAAESVSFLQAFVKIDLVPDAGSSWLLQRLVGRTRATELMLTGKKIGAKEALAWGLVNQVLPNDDLMKATNELAQSLATMPTKAIGLIKRMTDYSATHTLAESLDNEADMQELAGRTADHREGLMAFLEKRMANFRGE